MLGQSLLHIEHSHHEHEIIDLRLERDLARRMMRPQRHRLLQGYPMAPLMRPVETPVFTPYADLALDATRPLIVGVLPHTFCNPRVTGCGFCTFPHEKLARGPMRRIVEQVRREIVLVRSHAESLSDRSVPAVYIGGGTANLTPPDLLEQLCDELAATFDLTHAELTLEGVPKYFLIHDEALLDVLERARVRHCRISMGVQTFDPAWLRRMGREGFGDRGDIARVVDAAHRRGFTVSADLLFNLPGSSTEAGLSDIRAAVDLGFDQICPYNLVLTPELDSEWARDTALVQAMPSAGAALASWLAVRELLVTAGYVQTTLTNFERADVARSSHRFAYELASFDPDRHDGIGFGPGAISTFTSSAQGAGYDHLIARKWINIGTGETYAAAIAEHGRAIASVFDYNPVDLQLLRLTRNLARMEIQAASTHLHDGVGADFTVHVDVLERAGLVYTDGDRIRITPTGMFYADSIAGMLASERITALRAPPDNGAVPYGLMG